MKKFPQYSTLKQTYYRNFILLIVIPLIFVFIAAELIVGYIIRESAIETIDALQTNIAATVSSDVKTNSLQLSHFIYTNDGEFYRQPCKCIMRKAANGIRLISFCSRASTRR